MPGTRLPGPVGYAARRLRSSGPKHLAGTAPVRARDPARAPESQPVLQLSLPGVPVARRVRFRLLKHPREVFPARRGPGRGVPPDPKSQPHQRPHAVRLWIFPWTAIRATRGSARFRGLVVQREHAPPLAGLRLGNRIPGSWSAPARGRHLLRSNSGGRSALGRGPKRTWRHRAPRP